MELLLTSEIKVDLLKIKRIKDNVTLINDSVNNIGKDRT